MLRSLVVLAIASAASVASAETIYGKKQAIDCDSKGTSCKISFGKGSQIQLPALVAFKSAHGSFLSVSPPNGGEVRMSKHPNRWEEWEMEKVGDRVAFKSHHNTFLSQAFHPAEGYTMAAERLGHETFHLEELPGGNVKIKGHNGLYLSALGDDGLRQESNPSDWETFAIETTKNGKSAIRSVAHGTYLQATNPADMGKVSHQGSLNTWETFVLDHVDKTRLTIETSHDTFVAAHADKWNEEKIITMERASLWELWTPYVNASAGGACFKAHDGRFLTANEGTADVGLAEHCMEHELFQVMPVDERMLAAAAREAAEKKKQAEKKVA